MLGRRFYNPAQARRVPEHGIEVWPGYATVVGQQEGGLMLGVDISHRVLRTDTVLSQLREVVT